MTVSIACSGPRGRARHFRPARRLRALVSIVCAGAAGTAALAPDELGGQTWTVTEAVAEALAHHPAVAASRARTRADDAGTSVARSAYLPSLRANASGVRFEEPMVVAPLHAFDPSAPPSFSDALVRSQLALGYTLFDGRRGPSVEAARAGATSSAANERVVRARVIEETVAAYNAVATARLVADASVRRRQALQAEVARADSAFQAGSAPRVETLRAQAALAQAEADHASAAASLTASERILARLTGRTNVPTESVVTPRLAGRRPEEAVPSETAEVAAATAGLEAARARHTASRRAFLPRVDLASSLDQFGATDESFTHEWQVGVTVSWPLYLGGSRFHEARRRSAELEEAMARLDRVRLEVDTERERARSVLTAAEGRVLALTSAEAQYAEVVRVEALALSEGSAVQRDLLAAEAALFGVRADLARARADVVQAQVTLARVDGHLSVDWLSDHLEESP